MACMWRSEDSLYESDLSFYHVNSLGLHSDYLVWWQAHLSTERPCCSLLFMQISVCLLNNFWNFCLPFINLTNFVENCSVRMHHFISGVSILFRWPAYPLVPHNVRCVSSPTLQIRKKFCWSRISCISIWLLRVSLPVCEWRDNCLKSSFCMWSLQVSEMPWFESNGSLLGEWS